jgi:leucyl-tRNA synthetase
MNERIQELQKEIYQIEKQLEEIWLELGPYTPHLSNELRHRLIRMFVRRRTWAGVEQWLVVSTSGH